MNDFCANIYSQRNRNQFGLAISFVFFLVISSNTQILAQYQTHSFSSNPPSYQGVGGWKQYISDASGTMGPNALPVPESNAGNVNEYSNFETRLISNNASGEYDQTVYMLLNSVIVPNYISLEVNNAIVEHYSMDIQRRIDDATWYGIGKGNSAGDINVNSTIQIIRNVQYLPDVAIRFNVKTTTGKNDWDARHIDAPGYFFDIAFGKDLKMNSSIIQQVRFFLAGGYYCWESNKWLLRQDDATMANAGIILLSSKLKLRIETGGYYGYKDNGDRPLIIRDYLDYKSKILTYRIGYEKGLHDYPFTNFFVGLGVNFNVSRYLYKLNGLQNISNIHNE